VIDAPVRDTYRLLHYAYAQTATDPDRLVREAVEQLALHRAGEPSPLEAAWYASLADGGPDYSIYASEAYLAEAWTCWVAYSRVYLRSLRASPRYLGGSVMDWLAGQNVQHVTDIGCGIGFTTAAWTDLLPDTRVVGTNLPGAQARVAGVLADRYGFTLTTAPDEPTDLLYAAEYFEHFPDPVAHLDEVLAACTPRIMLVASTFSSPSVGHFPTYLFDGVAVPGSAAAHLFHEALRQRGWTHRPTRIWNHKPALWTRDA
jgi:SAM-dependent methyltransferase